MLEERKVPEAPVSTFCLEGWCKIAKMCCKIPKQVFVGQLQNVSVGLASPFMVFHERFAHLIGLFISSVRRD